MGGGEDVCFVEDLDFRAEEVLVTDLSIMCLDELVKGYLDFRYVYSGRNSKITAGPYIMRTTSSSISLPLSHGSCYKLNSHTKVGLVPKGTGGGPWNVAGFLGGGGGGGFLLLRSWGP
jgi:hypothetical protein